MSALGLGLHMSLVASLGVNNLRLANDKTVLDQLSHCLSAICETNFLGLVGVHPDLLLAALQN